MRRDGRVRRSVRYSYIDGIFASVMSGVRDTFIIPFGVALGGTTAQIGLLSSVPNLIASLAQIKAADITERCRSRKRVINITVLVHALMFLPMLLIPFITHRWRIEFLIVCYTVNLTFASLSGPPWGSLVSKYVPRSKRGEFFGFRNTTLGLVAVASAIAAGSLLSRFEKSGVFTGYAIIFLVAFFARMVSWYYLNRMYEPPFRASQDAGGGFIGFITTVRTDNFTRFVFYIAAMTFCVYLAYPFFAVYMLKDLKMGYFTYSVVNMASTLTILLMMDRWGRTADIFGNIRILKFCSCFVPVFPLLWLISHNIAYLIVIQVVAGFFWSGFNLAAANFVYDAVAPSQRTRSIAYFNVVNGTAMFLGSIIGGYAVQALPVFCGYQPVSYTHLTLPTKRIV